MDVEVGRGEWSSVEGPEISMNDLSSGAQSGNGALLEVQNGVGF